jgi:hypothetical protein
VNRGPQRDGELAPTLGVGSNVSLYAPYSYPCMHTCAQLHSRVGRTLVPSSAASGCETGWKSLLRVGVSTPCAPPTRLQLGQGLPYGMIHRVGAVAQLPGAMRMSPAAQYVERRFLVSPGIPPPQRPCAAVRMQIYHVSMLHEIWHVTHLNCPCGGMLGSAGVSYEYISFGWESLQLQHHEPRASA